MDELIIQRHSDINRNIIALWKGNFKTLTYMKVHWRL